MQKLFALFLLLMAPQVFALEVAGIVLPETAKVGNVTLQLNGAGIRTRFFFRIYAGALYLPKERTAAATIIADDKEYRVILYILRELSSEQLFNAFNDAITDNHTAAEMAKMEIQIKEMQRIFDSVQKIKTRDIVMLDHLPDSGVRITVNGTTLGTITGLQFSRAVLKIWLGKNPVQEDMKKGFLGG